MRAANGVWVRECHLWVVQSLHFDDDGFSLSQFCQANRPANECLLEGKWRVFGSHSPIAPVDGRVIAHSAHEQGGSVSETFQAIRCSSRRRGIKPHARGLPADSPDYRRESSAVESTGGTADDYHYGGEEDDNSQSGSDCATGRKHDQKDYRRREENYAVDAPSGRLPQFLYEKGKPTAPRWASPVWLLNPVAIGIRERALLLSHLAGWFLLGDFGHGGFYLPF